MPTTKKKTAKKKGVLVKKDVGRPTVVTEDVVRKLESVFKLGVKDNVACNYAGIPERTYYDHLKGNEDFRSRIRAAQNYPRIAAGQTVVRAFTEDNDVQSARWWLEKKHPDEFGGGQLRVTQATQINKIPILGGISRSGKDSSGSKNNPIEKKN
jgi:hypothetical protein